MNIALWEQNEQGHWVKTRVQPEDLIKVQSESFGTVFIYERAGKRLAVNVDDMCREYLEVVVPLFCSTLDTLRSAMEYGMEVLGLGVELLESTEHSTHRWRENSMTTFRVVARV